MKFSFVTWASTWRPFPQNYVTHPLFLALSFPNSRSQPPWYLFSFPTTNYLTTTLTYHLLNFPVQGKLGQSLQWINIALFTIADIYDSRTRQKIIDNRGLDIKYFKVFVFLISSSLIPYNLQSIRWCLLSSSSNTCLPTILYGHGAIHDLLKQSFICHLRHKKIGVWHQCKLKKNKIYDKTSCSN